MESEEVGCGESEEECGGGVQRARRVVGCGESEGGGGVWRVRREGGEVRREGGEV